MDKLQGAQLQVVLSGTRASFRRRVMDAMGSLVAAPGAFCFFGRDDARAYGDGTRLVDGANRAAASRPAASPCRPRSASTSRASSRRRAARTRRASSGPRASARLCRTFETKSSGDGFTHALLLFLHEGGMLFGLAGLERRAGEPAFEEGDRSRTRGARAVRRRGRAAQLQYDELSREAAALRALGKVTGAVYVIDRDRKRVVWAADREHGIDWEEDVEPVEGLLVDAAEQSLSARAQGDALPTPPRLPNGGVGRGGGDARRRPRLRRRALRRRPRRDAARPRPSRG